MPALVFDLGGTYLRCGVSSSGKYTLDAVRRLPVKNFVSGYKTEEIWRSVVTHIVEYHAATLALLPHDAPLVVAFPGPIENRSCIVDAPTLVGGGSAMPDLGAELKDRTGRVVHLLNDVSAAAWWFSTKTTADRFLVVTVSSGIGSKLFDRNHPMQVIDTPPYAGEIGHVVVDPTPGAFRCDCGGQGHLGAIASGRGVERFARKRAAVDTAAFLRSACVTRYNATPSTLTNERHLIPAAIQGDAWALTIINKTSEHLARVLVTLITACGLSRVFLIGGFALSLGAPYLRLLQDLAELACGYSVLAPHIRELFELGQPTDEVCLKGAAIYADRVQGAPQ